MSGFSDKDQKHIQQAIEEAEKATSGEIRIFIEKHCRDNVLDRAVKYFYKLGMGETALRNGVLIYLATEDHKFAIIGDAGINQVVPENFWDSTKEIMRQHFKQNDLVGGIIIGVQLAGEQLKKYFPYKTDDKNELPNHIIFGDKHNSK